MLGVAAGVTAVLLLYWEMLASSFSFSRIRLRRLFSTTLGVDKTAVLGAPALKAVVSSMPDWSRKERPGP